MLNKTELRRAQKALTAAAPKRQRMACFMTLVMDHAHKLKGPEMPELVKALELPRAYAIDGRKALAIASYKAGGAA